MTEMRGAAVGMGWGWGGDGVVGLVLCVWGGGGGVVGARGLWGIGWCGGGWQGRGRAVGEGWFCVVLV